VGYTQSMQKGARINQGRTAEIYAWGDSQVLKLFREDWPPDWVAYEARVGRAVYQAGLGAPAVGEIVQIDGRQGIIYERIPAISMLDELVRKPYRVLILARQFARLHTGMHALVQTTLPSQRENLIHAIQRAPRITDEEKEAVNQILQGLPDGEVVCHGDFHPGNVLLSRRGPLVIDWMTATRGRSVADVARTSLLIRGGQLPTSMGLPMRLLIQTLRSSFHRTYLKEYSQAAPLDRSEMGAWLLPLAAARLSERISEEEERLLAFIRSRLRT
jgi:hypothetical protein